MPTLKKRHVKKSKKWYECDDCGRQIKTGSEYMYFYGMAEENEKPYALRICMTCYRDYLEAIKLNSA